MKLECEKCGHEKCSLFSCDHCTLIYCYDCLSYGDADEDEHVCGVCYDGLIETGAIQ